MLPRRLAIRTSHIIRTNVRLPRNVRRYTATDISEPQEQRPWQQGLDNLTTAHDGPSCGHHDKDRPTLPVFVGVGFAFAFAFFFCKHWFIQYVRDLPPEYWLELPLENLQAEFKNATPEISEATEAVRKHTQLYSPFIPGLAVYRALQDIDAVRINNGKELDSVIMETYAHLWVAARKDQREEQAADTWTILTGFFDKLACLHADLAHVPAPEELQTSSSMSHLSPRQTGINFYSEKLRELGDMVGPEGQTAAEETLADIQYLISQGVGKHTMVMVRKMALERMNSLLKLRDRTWTEGIEELGSLLEEQPHIRDLVEQNASTLRYGNVAKSLGDIKEALEKNRPRLLRSSLRKHERDTTNGNLYWHACEFCCTWEVVRPSLRSISTWMILRPTSRYSPTMPQFERLLHDARCCRTSPVTSETWAGYPDFG